MKKNTAAKNDKTSSTVTIANNKLILSLPNAQIPTVWQMDINNAQSSAFSVKEGTKKSAALISKDSDGTVDEIAKFDDKQTAIDILMEISQSLQQTNSSETTSRSNASNDNKAGAIIAIALIIVLLLIWTQSSPNTGLSEQRSASSSYEQANDNAGVSMNAEDFLSNR